VISETFVAVCYWQANLAALVDFTSIFRGTTTDEEVRAPVLVSCLCGFRTTKGAALASSLLRYLQLFTLSASRDFPACLSTLMLFESLNPISGHLATSLGRRTPSRNLLSLSQKARSLVSAEHRTHAFRFETLSLHSSSGQMPSPIRALLWVDPSIADRSRLHDRCASNCRAPRLTSAIYLVRHFHTLPQLSASPIWATWSLQHYLPDLEARMEPSHTHRHKRTRRQAC
jgi:hypothetical protein